MLTRKEFIKQYVAGAGEAMNMLKAINDWFEERIDGWFVVRAAMIGFLIGIASAAIIRDWGLVAAGSFMFLVSVALVGGLSWWSRIRP